MTNQTTLAPIVRELVVRTPIDTYFHVFVEGIDSWWPREHHIGADRTVTEFRVEPFAGGRCYDVDTGGGESVWGTVLAVEPPDRFAFAWHVQTDWTIDLDPARQSEVEVTFATIDAETTKVRLEHRGIERHGPGAAGMHVAVSSPGGWSAGLNRLGDVLEGRAPRPLPTD